MEVLHWLYALSGTILVAFYVPQMIVVLKTKSACKEISLISWGIWAACMMNSFLYAHLVLNDVKASLIALFSGACCFFVFAVATIKRRLYKGVSD